jgi:hypothetical protein
MRRLSREHFFIVLAAAPVLGLATLWIKSYFGNDYLFCRWVKVTDESGHSADLLSRTPREWLKHPGSKFQTRYIAVASRGGGVCFGLVLGRYLATPDVDAAMILFLMQEQRHQQPGGRNIGTGHSSSTEYPLSEEHPRFGLASQNFLYTSPGEKAVAYREHWAVVVPHWLVFAFVSLPSLWYLRRLIRRLGWRRRGFCPKCGYDIRATPGKCPECGTAFKPPSA